MGYRTGIGYDLHRTRARACAEVLGGVRGAPGTRESGLLGHSDADVVLHALCDALLGAAGLGDIGELFPDTDPAYRDADSKRFVAEVLRRVAEAGFAPANVDLIIHAQHRNWRRGSQDPTVASGIAGAAAGRDRREGHDERGLDAIGRGEAIACWVTVLLRGRVD